MIVVRKLLAYQYLEPCSFFLGYVLSQSGVLTVWLAIEANKERVVKETGISCLERSNHMREFGLCKGRLDGYFNPIRSCSFKHEIIVREVKGSCIHYLQEGLLRIIQRLDL